MLPHLIDLESPFKAHAERSYVVSDLLRYALATSDYWADLAVGWIEQGAPASEVWVEIEGLASRKQWPQPLRHRAGRILKQAKH